jgi:hypothetical protein
MQRVGGLRDLTTPDTIMVYLDATEECWPLGMASHLWHFYHPKPVLFCEAPCLFTAPRTLSDTPALRHCACLQALGSAVVEVHGASRRLKPNLRRCVRPHVAACNRPRHLRELTWLQCTACEADTCVMVTSTEPALLPAAALSGCTLLAARSCLCGCCTCARLRRRQGRWPPRGSRCRQHRCAAVASNRSVELTILNTSSAPIGLWQHKSVTHHCAADMS